MCESSALCGLCLVWLMNCSQFWVQHIGGIAMLQRSRAWCQISTEDGVTTEGTSQTFRDWGTCTPPLPTLAAAARSGCAYRHVPYHSFESWLQEGIQ